MDKKLKQLKGDFNRSIPSKFTERDRERVFRKIHSPEKEKGYGLIPKTITVFALLATTILLIVIFSNQTPGLAPENQGSPGGLNENTPNDFIQEDSEMVEDEDYRTRLKKNAHLTFNYHLVSVGDQFDLFTVTNIKEQENKKIITFESEELLHLFGDLIYREEWLFQFEEFLSGLDELPLEVNDLGEAVQFKLVDEHNIVGTIVEFTEDDFLPDTVLPTKKFDYVFSESGSEILIHFSNEEISADLYRTPLEIDQELVEIYEDYRQSYDKELLVALEPIDLIKFYSYGAELKDEETLRTFFYSNPRENLYDLEEILTQIEKILLISELDTGLVSVSLDHEDVIDFLIFKTDDGFWEVRYYRYEDTED